MLGNLTVLWYHKSIETEGFSGHAVHRTGVQRSYQFVSLDFQLNHLIFLNLSLIYCFYQLFVYISLLYFLDFLYCFHNTLEFHFRYQ